MSGPTSPDIVVRVDTDGHVRLITLDRPAALNALSDQLMTQLAEAVLAADADPGVRAVVVTGSDRAFCAGADVSELDGVWAGHAIARDGFARPLFDALAASRKPLVAAVRGIAFGGGCELALAADVVVAGDSARFAVPEVRLGLLPGAGGTQRLVHALGKAKAMRMLLTGDAITAREAYDAGLASDLVPDADCLEVAMTIARRIAANGPLAVQLARDAARAADENPLTQGLALERRNFFLLIGSHDQKEGVSAFLAKRTPTFTGR